MAKAIVQQAGLGLGIVGDGKGWSGGATRSDGEANQSQAIKEKRPKVFLEVTIENRPLGRIVLELFGDVAPKTVENFRCLCTGERGVSAVSGKPLHLKGAAFRRVVPGKFIQGGEGLSIYNQDGDGTFPDETFKLKHDRPGLVSMAHHKGEAGKNAAEFFITSEAAPRLDGKHVVFGRVVDGLGKLSKLESIGSPTGRPLFKAVISDCGELESEAMRARKRKGPEAPLPPGWERKESRTRAGLFYYTHESGHTQFERPSSHARDPLSAAADLAKRRRLEAERADAQSLPVRAVRHGEVRAWHIMKKHRDFFGKPASSWRQKEISWSKKEAKAALEKLRDKLLNVSVGGGAQALQRKFENYARLESDDDVSAKVGGDLGPIVKKRKLFGGLELAKAAFELEVGDLSLVDTLEGCHLVARFE